MPLVHISLRSIYTPAEKQAIHTAIHEALVRSGMGELAVHRKILMRQSGVVEARSGNLGGHPRSDTHTPSFRSPGTVFGRA